MEELIIKKLFEGADEFTSRYMTLIEIVEAMNKVSPKLPITAKSAGRALQAAGYQPKQKRFGDKTKWVYLLPTERLDNP